MSELLDYVRLLEGKERIAKRRALVDILMNENIDFKYENFQLYGINGSNLIAELGKKEKKKEKQIILSAHYDTLLSPGANDNTSSVAVLIDSIKKLKKCTLKNKFSAIFFDREEWLVKHLGSEAYIKEHGVENIAAVYNLEMVGIGDTAVIWPVKENTKSIALDNLKEVFKKFQYNYIEVESLPFVSSDHINFQKNGLEESFCISVINSQQIEKIKKFIGVSTTKFFRNYIWLKFFSKNKEDIPPMFNFYHTPADTFLTLNKNTLEMISKLLQETVKNLDKKI